MGGQCFSFSIQLCWRATARRGVVRCLKKRKRGTFRRTLQFFSLSRVLSWCEASLPAPDHWLSCCIGEQEKPCSYFGAKFFGVCFLWPSNHGCRLDMQYDAMEK